VAAALGHCSLRLVFLVEKRLLAIAWIGEP